MKSPIFSRRRFLGSLLLVPILSRCKKDSLSIYGSKTKPLPAVITDDFLAQYKTTEMGHKLVDPDPAFNQSINGYTDKISYNPGDTINVFLSGPADSNAAISLMDASRNTVLSVSTPIAAQSIKSNKPWVDGFMYDKTFSFKIPNDFKTGMYTWQGIVPFICKAPNRTADITVVYPSNTMNAYNCVGGKSIYAPDDDNRSTVLSFLRSRVINYKEFYQWIDKQPYTTNYIADSDLDDYSSIANSKIVVIIGHSEYWTRAARVNIDKFIDSGKNVLILSGNNMWWQVRYNKNKDLMICYKDSNVDPLGYTLYDTTSWSYPILNYPIITSIGADFSSGGYGNTLSNRWGGYKIVNEKSPIFSGASLKNGDILNLETREYDSVPLINMIAPGSTEVPAIDHSKLNFDKVELLGYDFAQNTLRQDGCGLGTFIVCKKKSTSGTVVNTASMDFTLYIVYEKYKTMTKNMIDLSLAGKSLFSDG